MKKGVLMHTFFSLDIKGFYNKCWGQAMNLTPLACKK